MDVSKLKDSFSLNKVARKICDITDNLDYLKLVMSAGNAPTGLLEKFDKLSKIISSPTSPISFVFEILKNVSVAEFIMIIMAIDKIEEDDLFEPKPDRYKNVEIIENEIKKSFSSVYEIYGNS